MFIIIIMDIHDPSADSIVNDLAAANKKRFVKKKSRFGRVSVFVRDMHLVIRNC